MKSAYIRSFALCMLGAGISLPSYAQYVGRVDTNKDAKTPTLRATAVLEYTGDVTRPVASRLVPLAVWDGSTYQPGGLYMAQPVPMAVESGTQYELELAGVPKGLFDVKAAADVSGSWIAIGAYQKPVSPKASKLRASKNQPQFVHDAGYDDDKPHFAHRPAAQSGSNNGSSGSSGGSSSGGTGTGSGSDKTASNAPPVDPDRPTLHKRTDSGSGSNSGNTSNAGGSSGSNSGSGTGSASGSGSTSGSGDSGSSSGSGNAPSVDPDRPTLHRHGSSGSNSSDNGAPVSATMDVDPDRPRLRRGVPTNLESLDVPSNVEIAKLAGKPENLEQMVAVSDIKTREPHNFVYSWTDPDTEKKMQSALEDMAKNLLAGKPMQPAISSQPAPAKKTTTAAASQTATHPGTTHRTAKKPTAPALPELANEQFKAYALTFGGGATLVFSAQSTMPDGKVKYVLLIAQPDFNGTPQVIYKQVTSEDELDVIPRMQLVDAADTDADNRAELIFELAGKKDRQYAIYRVAGGSVEQVFSTAGSS
ncbi:hypothetical protein HNQ77_003469 [Silvibacterium bohemicum]|uniref:Uncharacterized protein n=3 Tax=Silvibacterium bohemicum TaxID=1577686 RepID=A0A841K4G0_9BACT|nr:hypothetical protein [Silvibacterium bohemicum]MBB6145508.1 hypothetical protein [Silvibacterium bohemicum]